jgi:hypothetical protein
VVERHSHSKFGRRFSVYAYAYDIEDAHVASGRVGERNEAYCARRISFVELNASVKCWENHARQGQ